MRNVLILITIALSIYACNTREDKQELYLGADLSYLNEMLDCNGEFRVNGELVEPYKLFADKGCELVRVRLWNNPDWTNYSDYEDVKRTIREAKKNNMQVLLDFHYSDTWADPHKQLIPKAWAEIKDVKVLGDSVYNFTYYVLNDLYNQNLLPEFVQVGNETNIEILMPAPYDENSGPIDWERNAFLLNKGLEAVQAIEEQTGSAIESMLHIAQPENALWWFKQAFENKLSNFEWIALSYYPKWSTYSLDKLEIALDSLKSTYNKRIMIVETAYPYGFANVDSAGNILGEDALIPGFSATPQGQLDYMNKLVEVTLKGGGEGIIYWEPAWVTNSCSTLWGQGSHWENATFFDAENGNEILPVFDFFSYKLP